MPKEHPPLDPKELRRRVSPASIPFQTSADAPEGTEPVVGQERAKEALRFGLAVADMDYHVFVDGPQRTGKTYLVRSFVERLAAEQPPPPDWVYVHNFRQPDEPQALSLPAGNGRQLAKHMEQLVGTLSAKIPELFESDEYGRAKEQVQNTFKVRRSEIFSKLDKAARAEGYVLRFEATGIMVAPADEDGQPLPEARIREMSEEERAELRKKSDVIQAQVSESLRQVASLEKEQDTALSEMDREMVLAAIRHLFDELSDRYQGMEEVQQYLEQVREDVAEHFDRFKKTEANPQMPAFAMPQDHPSFREYQVNVFVDNSQAGGAPVIVEGNPTYPNLFGRIERQAQFGALFTDFTLLRAGSLHRANGGYLVLPVLEMLKHYLPWEALKRSLRERKAFLEDAAEQLGYMVTRTLRPQPIPLDLKVILVGDSHIFHLLYNYDPAFPKLFKVRAQMAGRMNWEGEEVRSFLSHLCGLARRKKLLPLHRRALARLVELAAEVAGDRERLTLQISDVEDVVREASFYAASDGADQVDQKQVEQAIAARRRRASMVEERFREGITRGFINVETTGSTTGQINGLAVLSTGDHTFGVPSRISCSLGMGKGGVVAIDRESKLSGPFHTKGVLILAGFLRERFARQGSLALTASLVFEQSYSTVDGDSASLAELLVLLSQLSGAPLRQDLAVTGSVDQAGRVQAIGGVNQKIEGFFRLCAERGLTGRQGVVIPASNVKNLMLHTDIVAAAKKGDFGVYPVSSVEEALEIFTGKSAGRPTKAGGYSKGSVLARAQEELARLRELAAKEGKPPARKRKAPARKKPAAKGRK